MRVGLRRRWVLLGLAGLVLGSAAPSGAEPPVAYRLQAAYVSKFLRFVEWPGGEAEAAFRVGVVGGADFQEAMSALEGLAVGTRAVEIRRIGSPDALGELDVLVVGPTSTRNQAERYLRAVRDRPILTVGDSDGFSRAGGIIEFVLVDDTMRFEISVEAANRAGLKVSSRLLRLARNVRRGS